jgi:cytochrome oxidase Cu insertion factor (SCO1/SenC/PrrC family)
MPEEAAQAGERSKRRWWVAVIATALGLGAEAIAWTFAAKPKSSGPADAIGGPFALTAGNGQVMTDRDFRGKWLLVYFGYTHCPDICPTTLAEVSETLIMLGPLAAKVQPLFISIDPERDDIGAVGTFVAAIDDRIVGLTGTPAQISSVAKEYHVFYAKSAGSGAEGDYAMDHTAFVYVMGPDGKYLTLFSPLQGQTPDAMAAKLRDFVSAVQD